VCRGHRGAIKGCDWILVDLQRLLRITRRRHRESTTRLSLEDFDNEMFDDTRLRGVCSGDQVRKASRSEVNLMKKLTIEKPFNS
jgi:hypothetical protein